jgi:hypothetical protein
LTAQEELTMTEPATTARRLDPTGEQALTRLLHALDEAHDLAEAALDPLDAPDPTSRSVRDEVATCSRVLDWALSMLTAAAERADAGPGADTPPVVAARD